MVHKTANPKGLITGVLRFFPGLEPLGSSSGKPAASERKGAAAKCLFFVLTKSRRVPRAVGELSEGVWGEPPTDVGGGILIPPPLGGVGVTPTDGG